MPVTELIAEGIVINTKLTTIIMSKSITVLLSALAAGMAVTMTYCSKQAKFLGSWTEVNPTNITVQIPGATSATSRVTIDFIDNIEKSGGAVTLLSDISVMHTIDADSLSQGQPYEVKITAKASVDGTWSYDIDDDDDLLLALDLSKLKIDIDKSNISFTRPAATVVPEAHLDSLALSHIDSWKRDLTGVISREMARYTVIDDIEMSRDGDMLTFEVHSPEAKLHFKRDIE